MSLTDHVQLTLILDSVGIARAGFGVPMILSHAAAFSERLRYYTSLASVAADFASGTPEYLAARAFFSQSPHPSRIAIGRATASVTQKYTVGVASVVEGQAYALTVSGTGFDGTTVSYTAAAGNLNDDIVAGLVTALNAVPDKTYTATATGTALSQVVEITANTANTWFSVAVGSTTALNMSQSHTVSDAALSADLDAILLEDAGWYELHTLFNSADYALAAADWVEANKRIYVFDTNDSASVTTAYSEGVSTDTLAQLFDGGYARTMGAYHPDPSAMFAAAWMGRWLPTEPGAATTKGKTLSGVSPVALTGTHRNNLIARRANSYQRVAGRNITWEGTVPSTTYRFLDVVRDLDWVEDDMAKGVFGAIVGTDKVPYTSEGILLVENEVRASVNRAVNRGIFADDPAPVVTTPDIADVATVDKEERILRDVKFSATLAGAIHKVIISGVVTF
jgi:hypothetical protein